MSLRSIILAILSFILAGISIWVADAGEYTKAAYYMAFAAWLSTGIQWEKQE